MSLPSSPTSSSADRDDFAALIDAELQCISSDEELLTLEKEEGRDRDFFSSTPGEIVLETGTGSAHAEEIQECHKEIIPDRVIESSRKRKHMDNDAGHFGSSELESASTSQSRFEVKRPTEREPELARKGNCPPHPGFMWGVCIRCGVLKPPSESGVVGVALRYIHEELELTGTEAERMRYDELKKVLAKKKLYLVLDLDHTMLNSARFIELPPEEESYLISTYFANRKLRKELGAGSLCAGRGGGKTGTINGSLHKLEHLQMWTKLRPFAHKFLEEASKIFEMYVYTMGERVYALAMAQLLDPKGRFFGNRVISQGDSTNRSIKDLDIMLGADSAVVILDDTEGVWPSHKANLVLMERYHFFSSSCKQFGISTGSLAEAGKDESEEDGTLANMLNILQSVHKGFFSEATLGEDQTVDSFHDRDVREVIRSLRSRVLSSCKIIFSRIFPTALPCPEAHPLWQLARDLGAVCTSTLDSSVTHVVALDRGTDKARWAQQHKRYLVHPHWVEAALYTWRRPREADYPVVNGQASTVFTMFSRTIEVAAPKRSSSVHGSGSIKSFDSNEASSRECAVHEDGVNSSNCNETPIKKAL
eukprot:c24495_g1_i1 orf=821-2596(-)